MSPSQLTATAITSPAVLALPNVTATVVDPPFVPLADWTEAMPPPVPSAALVATTSKPIRPHAVPISTARSTAALRIGEQYRGGPATVVSRWLQKSVARRAGSGGLAAARRGTAPAEHGSCRLDGC